MDVFHSPESGTPGAPLRPKSPAPRSGFVQRKHWSEQPPHLSVSTIVANADARHIDGRCSQRLSLSFPLAGRAHMRFLLLTFVSLLLIGCTTPRPNEQASRSIESFRFIGAQTTVQQMIEKLGQPDRITTAGIYTYFYGLSDGTGIRIGSPDGSRVVFVRHIVRRAVRESLFELP